MLSMFEEKMNKSLDNLCGLLTIKKIIIVIIVIITLYKFKNLTINTNAKPTYEITKIENKKNRAIEQDKKIYTILINRAYCKSYLYNIYLNIFLFLL